MLDAAVAVYSRRGYHTASMDEIAERAEVSKPMIYAYLGTKEALFVACIRREGGRLMDGIATAAGNADGSAAPDQRLWRGVLAFFEFVAAHRDGWIVLYHQARGQGGVFAEEVARMRERAVEIVAALLAAHVSAPEDIARTTPFACALVGAAEALADWGVVNSHLSPDALARRLMDFAWIGLGGLVRGEHWRGE